MTRTDALLPLAFLAVAACTGEDTPDLEPDPYQPTDHLVSPTTELVAYASCAALEAELETLAIQRSGKTQSLLEAGEYEPPSDGGKPTFELSGTPRAALPAPDPGELEAFTGAQAYVVQYNQLLVVSTEDAALISTTPIEGSPMRLFVDAEAGRALVLSQLTIDELPEEHPLTDLFGVQREEDYHFAPDVVTKLAVLDVSDPTRPTTLRETFVEGELVASARTGDTVQLVGFEAHESPDEFVVSGYFDEGDLEGSRERVLADIAAMTLGDFLPRVIDRQSDGSYAARPIDEAACQAISRAKDSHGDGQISLLSLDLADPALTLVHRELVGNTPQVALADGRLALRSASHASWWYYFFQDDPVHVDLFLFAADAEGTSHLATTRVVSESWPALDVAGDVVRLLGDGKLVFLGRVGDELVELSRVEGLGEYGLVGEFAGDRAFVSEEAVLHVIDLTDSTAPTAESLTLPGEIIRVEPVGERMLVFFDPAGTAGAATALVELDGAPGLVSQLDLGEVDISGLWTGPRVDVAADGGVAAVTTRAVVGERVENGQTYQVRSEIYRFVSVSGDSLSLLGTVDHVPFSEDFTLISDVRRAFFADGRVLVIGTQAASLHTLPDLAQLAAQPLVVSEDSLPTWWD